MKVKQKEAEMENSLEAKDKVVLEECQICGGRWFPDEKILKNGFSAESCPFCQLVLKKRRKRKARQIIFTSNGFW
jgi:hypothetical protein